MTASVDAKSVSTGNSLRNSDLRNKEEWFNTEKYPRINFKSKKFEKTGNGFKVLGDLTIKGITKPVEIRFTFADKEGSGVFKGQVPPFDGSSLTWAHRVVPWVKPLRSCSQCQQKTKARKS